MTPSDALQLERFRAFLNMVSEAPRDHEGRYLLPAAAVAYARGEDVDPMGCTGLAARWCPVHGDCTCGERPGGLDDPSCPHHGADSDHPAAAS